MQEECLQELYDIAWQSEEEGTEAEEGPSNIEADTTTTTTVADTTTTTTVADTTTTTTVLDNPAFEILENILK